MERQSERTAGVRSRARSGRARKGRSDQRLLASFVYTTMAFEHFQRSQRPPDLAVGNKPAASPR